MAEPGPLIVQSDRTLLLDADHEQAALCRSGIAPVAELERSPEHFHTYRITPISLWNARAAGQTAEEMILALERFSRYPVPASVRVEIEDQAARYGRLRLSLREGRLVLEAAEVVILEEVSRARSVAALLGERISPLEFLVAPLLRGRLKQALTKVGWPPEDLAGYAPGAPLDFCIQAVDGSGNPFRLRPYQVEAVESFWAGGRNEGGSGVLVWPCGAGKTLIGMGVMERSQTRTLVLTTSVVAVRQWRQELLSRTSLREDQVGEYTGVGKRLAEVTIATYQVLTHRTAGADRELLESYPNLELLGREDWGLVVYDEVHLLPAPVFRMTAEIQSKRRLGLTATLIREDGREDDVFSLIGPKRYDAPWRELEAEGWIAPAVCMEVRLPMAEDQRMEYAVADSGERYRLAASLPQKLDLVDEICQRHRGDRVLVIGQYLDQLQTVSERLHAPLITGATRSRERERLYREFRDGEIRLLVVSKVANFAIDLPEANVAIQISGAFGSRQEEAQRLGRVLRPKADGGQAWFYSLVTRETKDQEYASHRQLFLAEQGYRYEIRDHSEFIGASVAHHPV